MFRTCVKCGQNKQWDEFYAARNRAGRATTCKECVKVGVRENYAKNRERYLAYERTPTRQKSRRARASGYQPVARAASPEKFVARYAISNAIRDGRLIREPCEVCGRKAEAHHEDYSRPLDVRWLCTTHHRERHKQLSVPF